MHLGSAFLKNCQEQDVGLQWLFLNLLVLAAMAVMALWSAQWPLNIVEGSSVVPAPMAGVSLQTVPIEVTGNIG